MFIQNKCKWLIKGTKLYCEKNCIGDYCATHAYQMRKNPNAGSHPCFKCGIGVSGKLEICDGCGRAAYRCMLTYYHGRKLKSQGYSTRTPTIEEFLSGHNKNKQTKQIVDEDVSTAISVS
jgi:hypothetical protein